MRALEQRGLFDFEVVCPTPLPTAAVVVVDPFSSGSILAARVLHYKLRLVMVFSEVTAIPSPLPPPNPYPIGVYLLDRS